MSIFGYPILSRHWKTLEILTQVMTGLIKKGHNSQKKCWFVAERCLIWNVPFYGLITGKLEFQNGRKVVTMGENWSFDKIFYFYNFSSMGRKFVVCLFLNIYTIYMIYINNVRVTCRSKKLLDFLLKWVKHE